MCLSPLGLGALPVMLPAIKEISSILLRFKAFVNMGTPWCVPTCWPAAACVCHPVFTGEKQCSQVSDMNSRRQDIRFSTCSVGMLLQLRTAVTWQEQRNSTRPLVSSVTKDNILGTMVYLQDASLEDV